jgi:hypothetical protein
MRNIAHRDRPDGIPEQRNIRAARCVMTLDDVSCDVRTGSAQRETRDLATRARLDRSKSQRHDFLRGDGRRAIGVGISREMRALRARSDVRWIVCHTAHATTDEPVPPWSIPQQKYPSTKQGSEKKVPTWLGM